jgi:peptidoglycan/xylan/chitin deacetylase (PgdA/CDA1 family)
MSKFLTVMIAVFIVGVGGCNNDEKTEWELLGYTEKPTKYIALTFDDGPAGARTQELLDILAAKKVKATFFLIGGNIRSNESAAQAIFNAGHELANHSDGYVPLGKDEKTGIEKTDVEKIRTSLTAASAAIKKITGKGPALFRAPEVNYGDNLTTVCTELDLAIIGVNVWSHDYDGKFTAEQCKNNVLNAARDGGIINCHEANSSGNRTLPILAGMIDGLRAKGYWITTVGELATIKGKALKAGVLYEGIN